jgi:hypothetical protein
MPNDIFVLTGAGVSAESGLGTFRDKRGEGLWARFDPMKLATPEAFANNPEDVLAFYDMRRRNLLSAKPNAAHRALARLEGALAERGGRLTLVTQNIDDLHERAGSRSVIHMHGELLKARCQYCDSVRLWPEDLAPSDACPDCGRTGGLRPHVVWFGEAPLHMEAIDRRCAAPTSLSRLAPQARSIPRPASLPRRALPAFAPARSISRRLTTRTCSTSSVMAQPARRRRSGWRSFCERERESGDRWPGGAPYAYFAVVMQV